MMITEFFQDLSLLEGRFLVSSPFGRSFSDFDVKNVRERNDLIYVLSANEKRIIGVGLAKILTGFNLSNILSDLKIQVKNEDELKNLCEIPVFFGGPNEFDKGAIFHSTDYENVDSMRLHGGDFCVTKNVKILQDMARGMGPEKSVFVLGHYKWSALELKNDLMQGKWLTSELNSEVVFGENSSDKWLHAIREIGIKPYHMSSNLENEIMC